MLQPGEELEYQGRPSWVAVLHRPFIWMIVSFMVVGVADSASSSPDNETSGAATIAALVFLWAVYGVLRALVFVKNAEYVVTNRRVIGKYGFIRQHTVDIFIPQIAGVRVVQTALGRMFRYGNVRIDGTGGWQLLVGMAAPHAFEGAIHRRRSESRVDMGTAAYTVDVRVLPDVGGQPAPQQMPAAPLPPPPPRTVLEPASWHPDPTGRHEQRYWDGSAWTQHVSDAGTVASDPVPS